MSKTKISSAPLLNLRLVDAIAIYVNALYLIDFPRIHSPLSYKDRKTTEIEKKHSHNTVSLFISFEK